MDRQVQILTNSLNMQQQLEKLGEDLKQQRLLAEESLNAAENDNKERKELNRQRVEKTEQMHREEVRRLR